MEKKPHRISVILEEDVFERFDRYCEEKGYKKSTLIARLVKQHLQAERFRTQESLPISGSLSGGG